MPLGPSKLGLQKDAESNHCFRLKIVSKCCVARWVSAEPYFFMRTTCGRQQDRHRNQCNDDCSHGWSILTLIWRVTWIGHVRPGPTNPPVVNRPVGCHAYNIFQCFLLYFYPNTVHLLPGETLSNGPCMWSPIVLAAQTYLRCKAIT